MTNKNYLTKSSGWLRGLCSLLLLLGMWTTDANAQAAYTNDFNLNATGWTGTITRTTATTACGSASMRRNMYSSVTTGTMISPTCGTSNGALATLSYAYKVADWSANTVGTSGWGSFNVQYGATATGPWTTFQTINTGNHIVSGTCSTVVVTFTPPSGALFIKWDAFWSAGDYYINFDNVVVSQSAGSPCTTPAPGNTVSSANPVCTGASFTLTTQFSTPGSGVTYQWQSADDGAFTINVANLGTAASQVTSQTAAKYYQCFVTCSTGPSTVASSGLQVTMAAFNGCYCVGTANCAGGDHILSVNFNAGAINNASGVCLGSGGNSAYSDYTAQSANVTSGNTYSISVSVNNGGTEYASVWIDYNHSGTFDAAEYTSVPLVLSTTWNGTANITIDPLALTGTTSMRVRSRYSTAIGSGDACTAFSYGETEDYSLVIAAPAPCSAPAPGNTIATPSSFCAGGTSTLSLQNATTGTGVTYQWFDSPDGFTWNPIGGATNSTYLTPSSFFDVFYQCDVTCSTGPNTTTSNSVQVVVVAPPVGGTASGPGTGQQNDIIPYTLSGHTGTIMWQYSTVSITGPWTDLGATTANLNLVAPQGTYYLQAKLTIAGCSDAFSNALTVVVSGITGNDACNAIPLVSGINGPYYNTGASAEVGEPGPTAPTNCNSQNSWCENAVQNSIWFSFVAPASGRVAFLSPDFDTQLAMYAASSCSPFAGYTLLAANDDGGPGHVYPGVTPVNFSSWIDSTNHCLVPGQTYYLQFDGYNGGSGATRIVMIPAVINTNAAPTLSTSCPATINVGNDAGLCTAVVSWTEPVGSDPEGCTLALVKSHNPGDVFQEGTTNVTYTFTDPMGLVVSCNFDVVVTVNHASGPNTVTSNDADNEVCNGGSFILTSAVASLGTAGGVINWHEGATCQAGAIIGTGTTLNVTPSVGTHTYWAGINESCSPISQLCTSITVVVTGAPPSNSIGAPVVPASACSGPAGVLITVPGGSGPNIHYSWNTGSNSSVVLFSTNIGGPFSAGPFSTPTGSVYAQFGALGGGQSGYNICGQAVNACGSSVNYCSWVRGKVAMPGTIIGSPVGCPSALPQPYSCGLSGGATNYNWTFSTPGATITNNGTANVSVVFPAFVTGQLCVTASLPCGGTSTSPSRCYTISNAPALPAAITGSASVCPAATGVSYSVPLVTAASGYNWTVPAGASITSGAGTNSIQVTFPGVYSSGQVCVSATSACGSSVARCKSVSSSVPAQPGAVSGPTTNVCNSTVQYSVSGAGTFLWTPPAGTTIIGSATGNTILLSVSNSFVSGTLTVVGTTNLCTPGTSAPRNIMINGKPALPGSITANPSFYCNGATVNFSITSATPLPAYNWSTTNGTIVAGQGTNNADITWGTGAGTVNVTASNTCGVSGTRSQSFTSGCREEGVANTATTAFSVYPNPAHDNLTLSIDAKESASFMMQLRDVSGRIVLSENQSATSGLNTYDLNLTHLAKGVYVLEVQSAADSWKTKVVVE